jgi:anti-sigma factor RsiW
MNCQEIKNLLKPLFEGELSSDVQLEVRRHIASCPECRSGLNPMDLVEILPAFDESIEPSLDFASRFYAELQNRQNRKQPERESRTVRTKSSWIQNWSWQFAAAGVLIAVFSAGLYFRYSQDSRPDPKAVFYEMEVTDNLALFKDMALIEDLEFYEDLDAIESMPQ